MADSEWQRDDWVILSAPGYEPKVYADFAEFRADFPDSRSDG